MRIRRAHRISTKPGERKSRTIHNNLKDAVITLRPTPTIGTFHIQIVVGFAQDVRKYSRELKENQWL